LIRRGEAGPPPTAVTPSHAPFVKPSSVGQASDAGSVWAPTFFTDAGCPFEADPAAQLRPVEGIEPTQGPTDRHTPFSD
jgi:hypothetical protein